LEEGFRIKVIETKHDTIGVDTPEDLEKIKLYLEKPACRQAGEKI
jgi:CMP-2-keto-3-deoxyoctulosonic acid synthetase